MATAALRYCTNPGCSTKVAYGRCAQHQAQHRHEQRTDALHRLYDSPQWKALRLRLMREQPWCVACLAAGVKWPRRWRELDHVKPHRGNEEGFYDESNLQGLCHEHHAAKTRSGQ